MVRKSKSSGNPPEAVSDRLMASFDEVMLPNRAILAAAMDTVLGENATDREWIRRNASLIVSGFEDAAHRIYRRSEEEAQGHALRHVFGTLVPERANAEEFLDALAKNCGALDKFYMRVAQGRKARAGSALEVCLSSIFNHLGYPYSAHAVINGKPDFIFPSVKHFHRHPTDCIVFTSKRTLRERWRQVISEGALGAHFFLATLDESVRGPDLAEMRSNRINLVVPEPIRVEFYSGSPNVISFETFIVDNAEPAMTRWRRNGVVD